MGIGRFIYVWSSGFGLFAFVSLLVLQRYHQEHSVLAFFAFFWLELYIGRQVGGYYLLKWKREKIFLYLDPILDLVLAPLGGL